MSGWPRRASERTTETDVVRQSLVGWGRIAASTATVHTPRDATAVADALRVSRGEGRGLIARGLGRSYGDSAQNGGGRVVSTAFLSRVLGFDPATGILRCEAGVSLGTLIARFVPQGWWIPVTAGTRHVSLGGAIASDIHGKDHCANGSFGSHVRSLTLLTADGSLRRISAEDDSELFWATVGGMGLTGIILEATIQLTAVASSRLRVDTERAADLDAGLSLLSEHATRFDHTVAWVDALSGRTRLGRSVVTSGNFAQPDDLPVPLRREPLAYQPKTVATAPRRVPARLLNRYSAALFNDLWFHKAPRRRSGEIQTITAFFHPLDGVAEWNRVYGRSGFVQYQFVVPETRADVLEHVLARLRKESVPAVLAVVKRLGRESGGYLSFPRPGWTLAVDIPGRTTGLARLLARLDEMVLEAGGRLYLAKDVRGRRKHIHAMYPRSGDFRGVRDRIDPDRVFMSDQARRLGL